MKRNNPIVGLALGINFSIVLSFALPAYGYVFDPGPKLGSNAAAPIADQVLIHESIVAGSGVYAMRRSKKSWHSSRIAPRKPRKKLNPDSMAVNF